MLLHLDPARAGAQRPIAMKIALRWHSKVLLGSPGPGFRHGSRPSPRACSEDTCGQASLTSGSRQAADTTVEEEMPGVATESKEQAVGPCPFKNKGWNHLVSRRRQLNVWFREQGPW